jgi:Fe2+ transport system protein B
MSIKAWNDEQEAELTRLYLEEEIEDKSLTVKVMLRELEEILGVEVVGTNLNKKENLSKLLEAIKKKIG